MLFNHDILILMIAASLAMLLDAMLGEVKRFHPLVGFGWLANTTEKYINPLHRSSSCGQFYRGMLLSVLLISLPVLLVNMPGHYQHIEIILNILALYFCIGLTSLQQHAHRVTDALDNNDEALARYHASMMVSRDPASMHITRATTESVLENGNDAVFAALFWFIVAGAPGVVLYRLTNTLDAMWGYRNDRFLYFGRFAARLDDVLNYIPARLTALTYALLGSTANAILCWRTQGSHWDSPNAGPVMAAGAGALQITLGGAACYHGQSHDRIMLGSGNEPGASDIHRALDLVRHGAWLWIILGLLLGGLYA